MDDKAMVELKQFKVKPKRIENGPDEAPWLFSYFAPCKAGGPVLVHEGEYESAHYACQCRSDWECWEGTEHQALHILRGEC